MEPSAHQSGAHTCSIATPVEMICQYGQVVVHMSCEAKLSWSAPVLIMITEKTYWHSSLQLAVHPTPQRPDGCTTAKAHGK